MSDDLFKIDLGFRPSSDRILGEREQRLARAKTAVSFGIPFLDKAFGGILANDVVLIGAKSGVGKTELSTLIAFHNVVEKGRRVHYFALEAEENEIELRMKFKIICKLVRESRPPFETLERLSYQDWQHGLIEDITSRFDAAAEDRLRGAFKTLHTFYRGRDFDTSELERLFMAIQDQTDLIVLDHLHYIDLNDDNENRAMRATVKKLRDLALDTNKPCIIVAHTRKSDSRSKALIPTLEDFSGSKDIGNIATKAIMLAPAYDQPSEHDYLWNTYLALPKNRMEGARSRYVGLLAYDIRSGMYSTDFEVGRMGRGGEVFERVKKLPRWARQ